MLSVLTFLECGRSIQLTRPPPRPPQSEIQPVNLKLQLNSGLERTDGSIRTYVGMRVLLRAPCRVAEQLDKAVLAVVFVFLYVGFQQERFETVRQRRLRRNGSGGGATLGRRDEPAWPV